MTDYDKLIGAVAKYGSSISTQFFGIAATPVEALLRIGLNNLVENRYGIIKAMLFDKDGKIISPEDFWATLEDIAKKHPIEAMGLKFNEKDLQEIKKLM